MMMRAALNSHTLYDMSRQMPQTTINAAQIQHMLQ